MASEENENLIEVEVPKQVQIDLNIFIGKPECCLGKICYMF